MENKNLDIKSYNLSLDNLNYELMMALNESVIEFKLISKNAISDYYYKEKFDLSTINDMKYLIITLSDLKKAFKNFDTLLIDKKAKLIKTREDSINLNFQINLMGEELESNLELKKYEIKREDAKEINDLKKKIIELEKELIETKKELLSIKENQSNEMNKKIELMYEVYIKLKQEDEIKKQKEEEKQKNEELIRQEEEKKLKLNDHVNLLNDFQSQNIDIKDVNFINGNIKKVRNNIDVYPIIRNNERLYELACCKIGNYSGYHYDYNIAIYNILLNKKTNEIYNAHSGYNDNFINSIKHYYYSSRKKHFLLSSSNYQIKLWNISNKIIINELEITNNNNNNLYNNPCICSCLLFNDDNYIIFSGRSISQNGNNTIIFNNWGNNQGGISNSKLKHVYNIEATYIKDKQYVLLSGQGNTEAYDYNNNFLIEYKSKNEEQEDICIYCFNLFNKQNIIYLINGYSDGRVKIYDFFTAEEKFSIKVGGNNIYSLCSLNEKYFLVGDNKGIKVIDFEAKKSIKSYKDLGDGSIQGLEKLKISDKGEFIISYTLNNITLWKINN